MAKIHTRPWDAAEHLETDEDMADIWGRSGIWGAAQARRLRHQGSGGETGRSLYSYPEGTVVGLNAGWTVGRREWLPGWRRNAARLDGAPYGGGG